jgi:molecular chaperone GrpE
MTRFNARLSFDYPPFLEELETSKQISTKKDRMKYKKLEDQIEKIERGNIETRNIMVRQIADLENLIKAKDREKEQMKKVAGKEIMVAILPVLDSIDAGLRADPENHSLAAISDMLNKSLAKVGLRSIDSNGKKYDPFLHEVVALSDDGEDGIVQNEIQKGYLLNDEVIRTSKVIVSKR